MKKLYSLIKACMSSDMNLFKIKAKNNSKYSKVLLPLFISLCLMLVIGSNANLLFEKLAPLNLQYVILSMTVFGTFIVTLIEGVYKAGPLIFNCKDDDLLLSLPIKRKTVLFIRLLKFYIFELLFNSLFMIPIIITYIYWSNTLSWTFFLTSLVMIITLPIIPIILSSIIGVISSAISSRFKYKNVSQIIISMLFVLGVIYISYNINNVFEYLATNATSINDLIVKIYYPAGLYGKLAINFNIIDLLLYILINIILIIITLLVLSKFYFKINSKLKMVNTNKKYVTKEVKTKSRTIYNSLIRKELNTFFKTPVFIINSGFALVLFLIIVIMIVFKFDGVLTFLTDPNGINMSKELIISNLPILIFLLITLTSYMTSITNSVISLEGKNINILKSLPIKTKDILLSKVYSCLVITTPLLLLGDIILFIKFKIDIINSLLLIILSFLMPLVSHFVGIIINLKYPKLDAENSTEIVKQSTSSFISVLIGMILIVITFVIITNIIGKVSVALIIILFTIICLIIDFCLYLYLINSGVKDFNKLSI